MTAVPDFALFCSEILGEPISAAWATFYRVVEGLPLDEAGEALYRASTGRGAYEPRVYQEATGLCGRRSEKTTTAIKYLLWKIHFSEWAKQLRTSWFSRIGRHTKLLRVPLIAQDTRVARDILRIAESLALGSPVLSKEVAENLAREIVFTNGISLSCFPASKASVRGLTCPACLLDELAWVSIEGADDRELVRQVRPSMIQFGNSRRLLKLSTPWQRSGVLYEEYSQRLARPDVLVWQAGTATMTPRIAAADLERERLADPMYFSREYEAQFTDDLAAFIPTTDTAAAVATWKELAPAGETFYSAALDASGLSGGDRFTFGVAHAGPGGQVVDLLRGWQRAPVPQVLDEIASLCRAYRIGRVVADQYSFAFVQELMRQRGVELAQQAFSARSKPEIYFALKNALAAGKIELPDQPEMIRELRALESTRLSGGGYRIGAPRGMHDDYVTTLALLAHGAAQPERTPWAEALYVGRTSGFDDGPERLWKRIN